MLELRDFTFVHKYFIGEKQESLLFLVLGITAIIAAIIFYFFIKTHPACFKGAAIPLMAIGLIQVTVGYTVYARSDKQRLDIAYTLGTEPVSYAKTVELPRMEKVMKNFGIYRWVEIVLALLGIGLFFYFRTNPEKEFLKGLGIALAIQALLMLGADAFAEKRGRIYTNELNKLIPGK
ncbi:MAG: hypothetical protein IPP31_05825 [Chitinophagaceae bacterium]|nr:hypothetical protein [Chitinophagaceae bacterium]